MVDATNACRIRRTRGETGFLRVRDAVLWACAGCVECVPATAVFLCATAEEVVLRGGLADSPCPPAAEAAELACFGDDGDEEAEEDESEVGEELPACDQASSIMTAKHNNAATHVQHNLSRNRTTFLVPRRLTPPRDFSRPNFQRCVYNRKLAPITVASSSARLRNNSC